MSSPSSSVPGIKLSATTGSTVSDARAVTIKAGTSTYEALVGPGAAAEIGAAVQRAGLKGRPRIIADKNVWERVGTTIEGSLRDLARDVQAEDARQPAGGRASRAQRQVGVVHRRRAHAHDDFPGARLRVGRSPKMSFSGPPGSAM